MPQFHETGYGKRFFEGQLPTIIKQLTVIGEELKRMNDLTENDFTEEKLRIKHSMATLYQAKLKSIADEVAEMEPAFARMLDEYIK